MDFNKACLNLQINNPFSSTELKKQYRMMALKYHPDKHVPDTDHFYENKFKDISESYSYLNTHMEREGSEKSFDNDDYNSLFSDFLSSFFTNKQTDIQSILRTIIDDCQNISVKLFENMDKERAIQIFEFINTYQHILYISSETVERIKKIINDKIEHDNIIILNPNLEDLLNDNIFMLEFEGEKYYVPLWHDEIYYKHNKHDLVVKCIPELPEDISLDVNNNILVTLTDSISNIINREYISFHIGQRIFNIPVNELKIQKIQMYIIKKQGISIIQSNNVYDNTEKSNIVCNIQLS
tara:strand:+ start:1588 stop:2475 length:888 start_codon:yes stop_codon:yes gene_type:complete